MPARERPGSPWWQTGVLYQIYPRSFQDTPGPAAAGHASTDRVCDGVGDLPGITARLDYLVSLGIDALWISPFYPSPMADFGYDVADYTGVDPLFGTLADFDALLSAAHRRGLRVILDFVPNHTSDRHPWFLESRSSRDNPKRDWYLWHDPVPYPWLAPGEDTRPPSEQHPNNWMSHFGGPAWTWDEATGQFYLHSFLAQQPDLNWRNPEVREAMYAAMRFWLDRGVDGFRMDVLWLLIKDDLFRNNPPNPGYDESRHDVVRHVAEYNADRPETLTIVEQMRALLDSYGDSLSPAPAPVPSHLHFLVPAASWRVLIGEIYLPLPQLVRYYGGPHLTGANLPFNFHLLQSPWTASALAGVIRTYESLLPPGAWPNYVLGNHDQSRLASRIGRAQARVAAMLLLTLRGTPTLYYGDELGMVDVPIAPDQVRDPAEKNEPGKGRGRDPERSPMLWVDAPNAGFCPPGVTPWLPLQADFATVNAATQSKDPRSLFTLYRTLLQLRRLHDTLHAGGIAEVAAEGNVLRYRRTALAGGDSTDFLVLLNLGNEIATTSAPRGTVVLTTLLDGAGSLTGNEDGTPAAIALEPNEGLLIALDDAAE